MNNANEFTTFLTNLCGLTVLRARNETITFIDTFDALLSTSEDEIDNFVKNTHASNSARATAQRILIPSAAIIILKALRFELIDRKKCGSLPDLVALQGLDAANISIMRVQRTKSVEDKASFAALSKLPEVVVPKLIATNYEIFNTAFTAVVARTIGMNKLPLDYLMRETIGAYGDAWPTRTDKLKNCILFTGASFTQDRETLYSLYVQYVGTEGIGSNIINKYTRSKNGRQCYLDFESHFRNESYLTNKASAATASMNSSVYRGDRRNFTLETYYTVMSKAFNDLAEAGVAHSLNDVKKVSMFEQGLQEPQAIQWCIISKERWDNFPVADRTFDKFYNEFSKYITKFKTLSASGNSRSSRIGSFETDDKGGQAVAVVAAEDAEETVDVVEDEDVGEVTIRTLCLAHMVKMQILKQKPGTTAERNIKP